MNTWAILPVKGLGEPKQRLASILNDEQRNQLAEAMLKDLLSELTATDCIDQVLIITKDPSIADVVEQYHVNVLLEEAQASGLNSAVSAGVGYALAHGADRALILHADTPLTSREDIHHIVKGHYPGTVCVVPDRSEKGTNALLIDLPADIAFSYGENSYSLHTTQLKQSGLLVTRFDLPGIQLDIDTPDDLFLLAKQVHLTPHLVTSQLLSSPSWKNVLEHCFKGVA